MPAKRGDIIELGSHRLMCGDAGDPADVARLFGDRKPDLVFTSPPYAQQRDYGKRIDCWDTLMRRVFGAMPAHERTQVLVNLGLVHRKGEVWEYWRAWVEWMRGEGWRWFGWYVWDKLQGLPGNFAGRPMPSHEWIFHLSKCRPTVNRCVPCSAPGRSRKRGDWHQGRTYSKGRCITGPTKVPDSVWRVRTQARERAPQRHPAVFPVALPAAIHAAYTDPGELVYDPFAGSSTSILAAEQGGRVCYAMELHPAYVDIAVERWERAEAKRDRQTGE